MSQAVTVYAPATSANLGPGFDVLGLAIGEIGDTITMELSESSPAIRGIEGCDADLVPTDPDANAVTIAATALLRSYGDRRHPVVSINRQIPLSAGMGSSATASVAGAVAAAALLGKGSGEERILEAALAGESSVAGRHLDNIAPCFYGGITLVRSTDPIDVVRIQPGYDFVLALVTPTTKLSTSQARSVLPKLVSSETWIPQMANTAALALALQGGDLELTRRAMQDQFAEPARGPLIPNFASVKSAALDAGALGCCISGAGSTCLAICIDKKQATACAGAMQKAFEPTTASAHIAGITLKGATIVRSE